jgi:tellurite resistance-related uncharacterized protein
MCLTIMFGGARTQSDFTGGEFTTLEEDGVTVTNHLSVEKGDAIVFQSEKWHSVQVVESGTRRSLVIELWAGPRNMHGRDL